MMVESINIAVRCPVCSWRVMDKISPATGKIVIKCPRCHRIVEVDLALRRKILYRRVG
ncbi:DNA-directed RNA polymerase subunit P [Flavonifractor plautii]|nr:DNA-directed RNA polymerase subunit P [Flavonifractor plautii]